MTDRRQITPRDLRGVAIVAICTAALVAYRLVFVEPRAWASVCAAAAPPLACAPRAALLWLQSYDLWGAAGLCLGLWGFLGGPFAVRVAAVSVGIAGVVNYNATWGMTGAALGAWAWITAARPLPPARPAGSV